MVAAVPASLETHRNRILSELLHADALESTPSVTAPPTKEVRLQAAQANEYTKPLIALKQVRVRAPSAPQETISIPAPALPEMSPVKLSVAAEAPATVPTPDEMIIVEEGNENELLYDDSEELPQVVINPELVSALQTAPIEAVPWRSFKELVGSESEKAPESFSEDIAVSELKDSINAALETLAPEAEMAIQDEFIAVQLTIAELLTKLPNVNSMDPSETQGMLPAPTPELPMELVEALLVQCETILRSLELPAEAADVHNLLRIIAPPELLTVLFAVEPSCPLGEINPENKVSRIVPADSFVSRVGQSERYIVALGRKILTLHPIRLQTPLTSAA